MGVDGKNQRNLTNNPAIDGIPAWSPDGQRIAFTSNRDKAVRNDIYVMDADGNNVIRLTNHREPNEDPAWSPDGRRLAFSSDSDSPLERGFHRSYDMYVIDVESRAVTPVVRAVGTAGRNTGVDALGVVRIDDDGVQH